MSTPSFRFFNPAEIPSILIWMLIGWTFGKGIDALIRLNPIKPTKNDLKKTYLWFRLSCQFGVAIILSHFSHLVRILRFKRAEQKLDHLVYKQMWLGFWNFFRLNPQLVYKIFKVIENANNQVRINCLTGVNNDLDNVVKEVMENEDELERNVLPDLTEKLL